MAADERSRLAGEMHDVVSHRLNLEVLRAGALATGMDAAGTNGDRNTTVVVSVENTAATEGLDDRVRGSGGGAGLARLEQRVGLLGG